MESRTKIIVWDEIELAATQVFDLWTNHSAELKWGKEAWEILTGAGLTTYSNEIERSEKLIYFLSLAGIYRDFWCLAADECVEIEYKQLADSLRIGIESFKEEQLREYIRLVQDNTYGDIEIDCLNKQQLIDYIQLIRENTDIVDNFYNFCNSCFQELANQNRGIVYSSFLQAFGDNISDFFVFIWCSRQNNSERNLFDYDLQDDDEQDDYFHSNRENYEDDQYILNTLTPEKERAFAWISEGCCQC